MSTLSDEEKTPAWPFWLGALLVILVWGVSGFLLYPLSQRGTFGDMFGAVNALFSGLAFAGLIYTVWLQRKELQLQRTELSLTRIELEGQKLQLAAQNETLRKQNFEDTFFQLLRLHNDILNSIDLLHRGGATTRGRDCFKVFWQRFRGVYLDRAAPSDNIGLDKVNEIYLNFFSDHQSEIGHYFRSLYNVVKFVKQSDMEDKRLYTNLIRAQLSSYELVLLFYNCLSDLGSEKFKPLIEEFALFKTLPRGLLVNQSHYTLFEQKAYV